MDANFEAMLIANMPDAVVYSDRDGTIRYWNGGAVRLFGHTMEEAVGQSLDLIVPEGLRARHWEGYHQTMHTGRTRYGDGQLLSVPAMRKDGRRISVAFTIVPFVDDKGALTGIAAIVRDVTAQFEETRALRKEIAALRERGRSVSSRPSL
jgi:PAS domain S-box-containing protein